MLPIKKIYIDTRHSTADSKSTSDFKISLPNNITLPSNTAFYITDITVPVSWYTVEAGRNDTIYFRINGTAYAPSQTVLPEGNYSTTSLGQALCDVMSAHDPYGSLGSIINKFKIDANLGNNTIAIANTTDNFEILTDKQALALMYAGQLATKFPFSSVNDMLHNTVPQLIRPDINPPANPTDARLLDNWAYGYLNLHPIRNLYLISNTLGTYNSMAVNGE